MFRIYYADGSTYDGDPYCAPALGVLLILENSLEHGRRYVAGGDYYVYESERWYAVDIAGMFQYLTAPGARRILLGVMVENSVWSEVVKRASKDRDFPEKTAFDLYERHL